MRDKPEMTTLSLGSFVLEGRSRLFSPLITPLPANLADRHIFTSLGLRFVPGQVIHVCTWKDAGARGGHEFQSAS